MSIRSIGLLGLGWVALAWLPLIPANAQNSEVLRVLSSNGVRAAVEDMQAALEQELGLRLDIEFSTAAALARRIEGGEPFDVAILTPALIDTLVAGQKITANSKANFARTGIGIGARDGAIPTDLSTLDNMRDLLLAAESVAFTAEGQSRAAIDAAFERMGITDAMRGKSLLLGPGQAPGAVAAGQAELVLTLISEIVPVESLELLGPFPDEVQSYVTFAAGSSTATRAEAAARAFLAQLGAPVMTQALLAQGLEKADP
jgi:molybdate transport system substrate-binding protein